MKKVYKKIVIETVKIEVFCQWIVRLITEFFRKSCNWYLQQIVYVFISLLELCIFEIFVSGSLMDISGNHIFIFFSFMQDMICLFFFSLHSQGNKILFPLTLEISVIKKDLLSLQNFSMISIAIYEIGISIRQKRKKL